MSDSPSAPSVEKLLECIPAVYFRRRVDGSLEHVGGALELLLGLSRSELLGTDSPLANTKEHPSSSLVPETKSSEHSGVRVFRHWHGRTGELKTIQELRSPLRSAGGELLGYEGLWLDRTDWELVEKRLEVASWKEILCRLTAGFTHDLNNALTGLMAMSELLVSQADEKHPFHDAVNVVRQSTLKAADLVRRLNQLLQSAPGNAEFSDAGIMLTEALELLHKAIPRRVRVKQEITSESLPVRADAWRLRLLLLQLVTNALEAMPEGGNLYLQAARADAAPPGTPLAGQLPSGPWVRLSISDTGPALAVTPETLQPWFGTKASQMGTGLGLFIARKFCEQHQAALFVAAKEGVGTTIELWLQEANLEAEAAPSKRDKRLLLAGKDLREISEVAALCRANGYAVVVAPDLESVPRLLAVNVAEFDALVLAGSNPELRPVFDWLRRERLQIPKLALSAEAEVPGADLVMPWSGPETFLRRLNSVFG